tara:strand:+ start:452 stop:667 length:216 start_codon:yes stop_codon:yes gene_type:complete
MKIKDNPDLIRDRNTEAVLVDTASYEAFIAKARKKKKEESLLVRITNELQRMNSRISKLEEKLYAQDIEIS